MPRLALALCVFWFVALFAFRSVLQWRKTGSTGVKGFHGRIGSLAWIAGSAASLGLALAAMSPVAALLEWRIGAVFFSNVVVHLAGAALALVGIVGALWAQLSMGDSWRVGVDESESTELVLTGPYSLVRNPIFSFMGLSLVGLVFLLPNAVALLAGIATLVGIELQVRAVEEPYLIRTHGEQYAVYATRVGRFFPKVGRLRTEEWPHPGPIGSSRA